LKRPEGCAPGAQFPALQRSVGSVVFTASAMSKSKQATIEVQGTAITIVSQKEQDFISLTDIARFKNADRFDDLIRNWL
jgi:hypothetical protein